MAVTRFDIVSDTHGHLSYRLLAELEGADYILHAGDMILREHYETIAQIAPTYMCLGNNDWAREFEGIATTHVEVELAGLVWRIGHHRERLELKGCDVAICGHTHRPFFERDSRTGTYIMNPGSPTFPRTPKGPTIGRIIADRGHVSEVHIIQLNRR